MKLSIIIPVYNEIAQLDKTIKKLTSLKKKLKFELIFIDDFSNDGSYAHIRKYKKRFSFRCNSRIAIETESVEAGVTRNFVR